jgi:putative phage-type endonuclease
MDNIQQGSSEWFEMRLGKITASRISDLMSKVKTGESAGRKKLKNELIRERLTGKRIEGYTNAAMERGNALEPLARASYEIRRNLFVDQLSFVNHPVISMAGCSPDGLIGDEGLIEIKCPNPENHLEHFINDGKDLINRYYAQVQWQMACCGSDRKWCDLVSFDPDISDALQLFITRVFRDDEFIKQAEEEVIAFNDEIDIIVQQLKGKENGS